VKAARIPPEDINDRNWFKKAREFMKSKKLFPGAEVPIPRAS
jgi:hypothetical protein